jgi:ABC-type phosphate transport system ATPase subunit
MLIDDRRVRKVVRVAGTGKTKFVQGLDGKSDRLEELGVEGRIILKRIFEK